jgi:shikimate kinase
VRGAPRLVLVGAPASGKSRLAKRIGKLMSIPVVDTDTSITEVHGSIKGIFATLGEEHFRVLEREAVISALATSGIVSLGGGAVVNPATRADLAHHRVALITISEHAVSTRLTSDKRPLLPDGVESWKALLTQRQPWYEEVADGVFDTSTNAIDAVAADIVEWLEKVPA